MRANANAAAIAARDFRHGLLLPRGTAAAAPALIYQFRSGQVAIQPRQPVRVHVLAGGHNVAITGDRDLRDGWLVRTPIAHRGLHAAHEGRPENSLAAFARCCALGFPAELDVRLARDGEVVVFHDRALKRLTGAAGRVEERDAAELRALRLLGTDERVPLLAEVLELVGGRVPLLVELKSGAPAATLERAVLRVLDGYPGEVAIQSFKLRTVRARPLRAAARGRPPLAPAHGDRLERALRVRRLPRRRPAAPEGATPARSRRGRARLDRALARAGAPRAALRRQLHLRGLRAGARGQRPSKRGGRFSVKAAAASRASAVGASSA